MEDKLYFLDLGKEPNHLTPCKYLMENEGYYYFHDVSKSALEGVIAVPEGKLSEISRELRTIAPTPQLLACLGEYGVGDQKRVSIAVPDEQCIFTGYVDKDDEGYHVNYDILGQHRRMDMRQFGRDFCAVPLGRQVYPWTYSMFDPLSHGRNTEYGFLVNARTKGLPPLSFLTDTSSSLAPSRLLLIWGGSSRLWRRLRQIPMIPWYTVCCWRIPMGNFPVMMTR